MPDGAILQFADEKQRSILLLVIDEIEALIGETQEIETEGTATLIAVDENGAGYFATTTEDAYALRFEGGVPYIDMSQQFVVDPFGENGDVPGLPLPDDILRIITIVARDSVNNRKSKVEIVEENIAAARGGFTGLKAFISANRLVPVRVGDTDNWSAVTSLELALVLCPTLSALTDEMTMPKACCDVFVAQFAEFLSTASRNCTEQDKRRFERQRQEAEALLKSTADEILSQVVENTVIYRGR